MYGSAATANRASTMKTTTAVSELRSTGTVNGLLGLIWGAGSFVAPPVAGVIADTMGDRAAYGVLAGFCLIMAGWILRSAQRGAVPAAAPAS